MTTFHPAPAFLCSDQILALVSSTRPTLTHPHAQRSGGQGSRPRPCTPVTPSNSHLMTLILCTSQSPQFFPWQEPELPPPQAKAVSSDPKRPLPEGRWNPGKQA